MANDVKFEGKERRMAKIEKCLADKAFQVFRKERVYAFQKE